MVGGAACTPKFCDLSRGIVTDDATGTVTFHLTKPDSDFLYQLTFGVVVPAGTPFPDRVVASTGPYMVSGGLGAHFELVRNPYFREWSHAAQPAGFPDAIQVTTGISPHQQVLMLESGQADWSMDLADFNNTPAVRRDVADLTLRFPNLYHPYVVPSTKGVFFNVRVAPFNDLLAREAVNYAIDRLAVGRLATTTGVAQCQILPPNFPGYRPYCPYTVSPSPSGRWLGPDLPQADRLMAESHTGGASVTFIVHQGDEAPGGYIVKLLDRLGYRATLKVLPVPSFYLYISDYRNHPQAGLLGWGADYPSPAQFLVLQFACQSLNANPALDFNISGFCDPAVQRDLDAATAAQFVNRQAAPQLWADAERAIVDRAVWAPLYVEASYDVVSARVHNYQNSYGIILDQLWLQ
jgi:peptide/nickel transport system substrate-binding protein